MKTYDAAIVGAGMSGLAAGIRLAQYDRNVCILEKHSIFGGLNSFYRRNGRNYDVGLHAMTNYVPKGSRVGPLARIIRHLKISWDELGLVEQNGSSIAFPGVELNFDEDAIDAIAQMAVERNTGARGLRSIMEKTMMDVMYEIPSDESIVKCIVTKEAVEGKEKPILIRTDGKKAQLYA